MKQLGLLSVVKYDMEEQLCETSDIRVYATFNDAKVAGAHYFSRKAQAMTEALGSENISTHYESDYWYIKGGKYQFIGTVRKGDIE